jgi:hypothetical protein
MTKKTVSFHLNLPKELADKIIIFAEKNERTNVKQIHMMLAEYIKLLKT